MKANDQIRNRIPCHQGLVSRTNQGLYLERYKSVAEVDAEAVGQIERLDVHTLNFCGLHRLSFETVLRNLAEYPYENSAVFYCLMVGRQPIDSYLDFREFL